MTDHFDPYHKWLGIPPAEQPPDLYRLLGVVRFEADPDVISNAADQRMAHLRRFQTGPHGAESQRLLNEVAAARVVLLHDEKKMSYDLGLDAEQPAAPEAAAPPVVAPPLPPPVDGDALPSLSIDDDPQEHFFPPAAPLTLVSVSYSPSPASVKDRLEPRPSCQDFERADIAEPSPAWEPAPSQVFYDSPAASSSLSSIGVETKQWLDSVLAGLSACGNTSSLVDAKPWEQCGHIPVLPVVDGSGPLPPPVAAPPDAEVAPSWFDRWEVPSMAAVRAIWSIALTALLFLLALSVLASTPFPMAKKREWLVIDRGKDKGFAELEDLDEVLDEPIDISMEVFASDVQMEREQLGLLPTEAEEPAQMAADLSAFGICHAPRSNLLTQLDPLDCGGLDGRSGANRARLIREGCGSGASEAAVALALQWFANHQLPDGSWSFDHVLAPSCQGKCGDPGSLREARNGATAMALLAFLGAGQTHKMGKYKQNVRAGLYYLVSNMKMSKQGGSLHEAGGSMYSHGLASIALCEAYGMSQDRSLLQPAQATVNFICYAQDPIGGGWRYEPRQAGDMSVAGWQLMALKTAQMSHLQVPPEVIKKAFLFLDSVQAESGATYGYTEPGDGQATTSAGLLCRMHLGWRKHNPALQRGVKRISEWGVSTDGDMYYNYYATQVARHWGGDVWEQWNRGMHDWLVNSQLKRGHRAGSWYFRGAPYADRGGRHYMTALAALMLEAYYRHMPIYREMTTEDDFAL